MNKYWFKPKKYGYGFFPISWEGWLATFILVVLVLLSAYVNNFFCGNSEKEVVLEAKNGFRFLLDVLMISGLFTVLFKDKVKHGLQWRWGK